MKFLTKLAEMLKNFANAVAHSKIVRGGAMFAMALSIATAAGACTTTPKPDSDPNHIPTPNGPSVVAPDNDDDDSTKSQYSQILQNVLNSSYYKNLADSFIPATNAHSHGNVHGNIFQPLPYGFLEDEGFEITALKNDSLYSYACTFIKDGEPNSLYICSNVESTNAKRPYYNNYLLRYNLTDKELADYKMLYSHDYFLGDFFVQELSYQKRATVVSATKINKNTYVGLLKTITRKELIGKQGFLFLIFRNCAETTDGNCALQLDLISDYDKFSTVTQLKYYSLSGVVDPFSNWTYDNNILQVYVTENFTMSENDISNFKNSMVNITRYRTSNSASGFSK